MKILNLTLILSLFFLVSACASVPMESKTADEQAKLITKPPQGKANIYIYRDSLLGAALKKTLYINGSPIGETAMKTYFKLAVDPGSYKISTESEFSNNDLILSVTPGETYYVNQYIKLGAFVAGAGLKKVSEAEGIEGVGKCKLVKQVSL